VAYPLPDVDWPPTRPFWQAAARGALELPRCRACERLIWYPPERACPWCEGREWAWEVLSGRGRLFSWTVVERALFAPYRSEVPYVPALVALEEDPRVRLVSRMVEGRADGLVVDMPVVVDFRPLVLAGVEGEVMAPFFRPASN